MLDLQKVMESHAAWLRGEGGERANLTGANLTGANLTRANLTRADLTRADLWGAIGNGREICSIQAPKYPVTFTAQIMQIGCQRWTLAEWQGFDDSRIAAMDSGALEWWHVWKPIIFAMVAAAGFKVESAE